jgi:hypothetical protein
VNVVLGVVCGCGPGGGIMKCDRMKTEKKVSNVRRKRRTGGGVGE